MNEFYKLYPTRETEGQAQGCILLRSLEFNPLGDDSSIRMWAIRPLLVEWEVDVF